MSSYLEQIDAKIAWHMLELERLQVARAVIAGLTEEQKPHKKAESAPKPPQPKPQPFTEARARREEIRKVALVKLNAGMAINSADLIKELGIQQSDKQGRQDIYQTLYDLKAQGIAKRPEGSMEYVLAETEH